MTVNEPLQLGHVHLHVGDLDRSIEFYTSIFGLKLVERVGDAYAFLTGSPIHHTLALQALGDSARQPPPGSLGLYHVAFEVDSTVALGAALDRLDLAGASWTGVDHGISWAVYFEDPDGNGLEIYLDRREAADGRHVWRGLSHSLSRQRIRSASLGMTPARAEVQPAD